MYIPCFSSIQPSSSAIASNNTASSSSNRSNTSHNAASTPTSMRPSDKLEDDRIELVPGTNVFISTSKLQQILSVVKTGKQLARKLMSIYWDRITLARSTLSASSQHYDQLDPNTISAIKSMESYLYSNSTRHPYTIDLSLSLMHYFNLLFCSILCAV